MLLFPPGTHCTEKDVITKMGPCTEGKTQKTFYIKTNSVIELGFFFSFCMLSSLTNTALKCFRVETFI